MTSYTLDYTTGASAAREYPSITYNFTLGFNRVSLFYFLLYMKIFYSWASLSLFFRFYIGLRAAIFILLPS